MRIVCSSFASTFITIKNTSCTVNPMCACKVYTNVQNNADLSMLNSAAVLLYILLIVYSTRRFIGSDHYLAYR